MWIESNEEIANHPKTRKLARALGIPVPTAIGHLHMLWWWCLHYAQDGRLEGFDPEDIAEAVMWQGDPSAFVEALVTCGSTGRSGFLDRDEAGVLSIHDWDEYMGRLLAVRDKARERMSKLREQRRDGGKSSKPDESGERAANVRRTCPERAAVFAVTGQDLTGQDLTGQDLTGQDQGQEQGGGVAGGAPSSPAEPGTLHLAPPPPTTRGRDPVPYQAITDAYNAVCVRLPRANAPSDRRRKAMRARWAAEPERRDMAWWRAYFERVARSDFLAGANSRNWRADMDWLLVGNNMAKVLEGRYDPRPAAGGAASPPLRSPTEILMAAGLGPLRGDPDCVDAEVVGRD